MLLTDPSIHQELIKFRRHILTSLIIAKNANSLASGVLSPCLVSLEGSEHIRLLHNKINSREMQVIIDKCNPVVMALLTVHWYWAMHIREYLMEQPLSSHGRPHVRCSGKLPINAILTKFIMCLHVYNTIWDPINRLIPDKLSDGWKRQVVQLRMYLLH
jgi:hypothetical protein